MDLALCDIDLGRGENFLEEAPENLKALAYKLADESDESVFRDGGKSTDHYSRVRL